MHSHRLTSAFTTLLGISAHHHHLASAQADDSTRTAAIATATATGSTPPPSANPNITICRFELMSFSASTNTSSRLSLLPNGTATLPFDDELASPYDFFELLESGQLRAVDLGNNEEVYSGGRDLQCGFVDLSSAGGEAEEEEYFHCWEEGERRRVDNDDYTWRWGESGELEYRGTERYWWCEEEGVLRPGEIDDGELLGRVEVECAEVTLLGVGCIGYSSEGGRVALGEEDDDGEEDGQGGDENIEEDGLGDDGDDSNAVQGSTGGTTEDSGAGGRSGALVAGFVAIAAFML